MKWNKYKNNHLNNRYNIIYYNFNSEFVKGNSELKLKDLLNDPTNYYMDFSFTLTYSQIKDIFENKDYQLSINYLINYVDSKDYLYCLNHSNIDLSTGITDPKNKYKNILIDLKTQLIPEWALLNISIGDLFKINKLSTKLEDYNSYEHYFGNINTYKTFKKWLKIYLDNISLYKNRGNVYNELQLSNVYEFPDNLNKDYESNWFILSKYDSNLTKLKYKCLSIEDPNDIYKDSISEIKIKFILQNLDTKYDPFYIIDLKLKDFWICNK